MNSLCPVGSQFVILVTFDPASLHVVISALLSYQRIK